MNLPVPYPLEPMEAEAVEELPAGPHWQYEPKWDGFRAIVFRDGDELAIQSRNSKPLRRYFPELVNALLAVRPRKFVLDGEIMLFVDGKPSFETLQLRLHPALTRVTMLAEQHPVTFVAFDLLVDRKGKALLGRALECRRQILEGFMSEAGQSTSLRLSPATTARDLALTWLELVGRGLDGIVAKRLDQAYQPGRRAMQKFKLWQTVDCVVGGIYLHPRGEQVQSVLLGLYDDDGKLHYVGRSTLHADAPAMTEKLRPLIGGQGFSGRSPAGKNRWSGRQHKVIPLRPELVVEASADHITDRHFRHGARILRWRTDKDPRACTMDQIEAASSEDRHIRSGSLCSLLSLQTRPDLPGHDL